MKLTHVALVLALGLLGVTAWQAWDARNDAKGARNKLELFQQQKSGGTSPAAMQEKENQLLMQQMAAKNSPPAQNTTSTAPPLPPLPPSTNVTSSTKINPAHIGPAAMESAPAPFTQRQRLIMSVPAIAKVTQYEQQYGFVVITAGASQKLEKGMSFAVRRGPAIIGRIKITEVENNSAVGDLDSRTVPAGVTIKTDDEVIQDLPPEA